MKRTPIRRLHDDQRGAIAVAGAFMSVFLAATMWFIIGTGDAAVHRQRMQDGSDAGAYTSAVYHARGMNIVAMGNVVMAAEFSVKLSLDVSKILNKIELGILIAKCIFSPSDCAFIPVDISLDQLLDQLLQKLKDLILDQLNFLSKVQAKIAKILPYLAQARAIATMVDDYASHIDLGGAIGLSLVPEGKRLGMPIQEEKETVLCEKAATVIPIVALKPLIYEAMPIYVAAFVMGVTKYVSAVSCDDSDSTGKTPKKIFEKAKNGDEYFRLYGFALHLRDQFKRADKGVDLAAWGKAEAAKALAELKGKPFELLRAGMGETEFYYDEIGKWEDYKDEALWNLKWRARLRRYRPTPDQIKGLAPLDVANRLEKYVKDIFH